MLDSKKIGVIPTRIYSCEFAAPGKWTCILEVDEYKNASPQVDESFLPNFVISWALTRKELIRQESHIGVYHYTYEGVTLNPPVSPTDSRPESMRLCTCSASVSLIRKPIGMHVNFAAILSKYGGKLLYGEWDWPKKDPSGQSSSPVNPLYGVQEYLAPSVTLRLTKIDSANYLTPSIDSSHGYIDYPPQDVTNFFGIQSTGGGSGPAAYDPWLLTENSISQFGQGLETSKGWMSGEWNKIIYQKPQ